MNGRILNLAAVATTLSASLAIPTFSQAEVTRIVVDQRQPAADGRNSGRKGPYERIRGRIFGEVDPKDPRNAIIQDIRHAPVNARGKVEYIATFTLFQPTDPAKGNRILMAEIPNRGGRTTPLSANADMQPFFYDNGYSVVWVGWQADLPESPRADAPATGLRMESMLAPRAIAKGGSPISGRYLVRTPTLGVDGEGPSGTFMKLDQGRAGALAYFPVSYDTRRAVLTGGPAEDVNGRPTGPRYTVASQDWAWWDCKAAAPAAAAQSPADLCIKRLKGAFKPDETYVLAFDARDPIVMALGMAATRDAVSFFRYAKADRAGTPNPLAGRVDRVIGQGRSQVGNLVKTFIALGFNEDERGRIVWDGANAHIAGRRTPINYRFSTPGSSATLYLPGSEGVLWWGEAVDALRGGPARSMLDRCRASKTCPKIFETFGSSELWNQRMTPGLVNFDLKADIPLPANVRRYYFPGTTHGGGRGGFRLQTASKADRGAASCAMATNPNPEFDQMRALVAALSAWVSEGVAPPRSRYPLLSKGELVAIDPATLHFPDLPGVPKPFGLANPVLVYDYGPSFDYVDMSGVIARMPPAIKGLVPALAPVVDSDGNETTGAPSVQMMAPLGSFLGWNVYRAGPYAGQICSYNGGFAPFARTAAERLAAKDPRPSIEERYHSRAGFVAAVQAAVDRSVGERLLLPDDGRRLVAEARAATEDGDLSFLP